VLASLLESIGFLILAAVVILLVWIPLNWRSRLKLVRRFTIKADKAAVWQAVFYAPGDVKWHPHLKKVSVLDGDQRHMRLHYGFESPDGRNPEWSHDVAIETLEDGAAFKARRLDVGDDENDKLLDLTVRLMPRDDATVISWQENWGPRSLAGRFMAYSDADKALEPAPGAAE